MGVDYMDFADGSDFVKGIGQFDEAAKAKGIFVLSGVSSFPVLTAAVVRRLSGDLVKVNAITAGIAPSPFAGVGENVIRAIAAYAGQPVKLVRNGHAASGFALTEIKRYTIAPPGRLPLDNLRFSLVDVPDLQVLPELWPGLDGIWMGAAPVPEILHRMLNGLAWLVRWRMLPSLSPFASVFFYAVNTLRWGEHRGGMFVQVEGLTSAGASIVRSWHLLAEGNDGPFIPCMALEAVVKRSLDRHAPAAGARPASGDLELADYEKLFAQRTIYTGQRETVAIQNHDGIFRRLLGSSWGQLASPLKRLHTGGADQRWSGSAHIERGQNWLARVVGALFGFPAAGTEVDVQVNLKPLPAGERWTRTFGGRSFSSFLSLGEGRSDKLLCERFGPFTFGLALVVEHEKLRFVVRRWQFCGISLPRFLAPAGDSYESEMDGHFYFHIEIKHPLTGLIVKYKGRLMQVDKPAAA